MLLINLTFPESVLTLELKISAEFMAFQESQGLRPPRLPVIAELTNEFTNAAVAAKSLNCVTRSNLNFSTTLTWTFGDGSGRALGTELNLMTDRVGVWPKAFELGIRMRNLEAVVNRPPVKGICINSVGGCTSVNDLINQAGSTPLNERPVNAFMSAYRNLGGGQDDINQGADHLGIKSTLKITELSPTAMSFQRGKGLSGFLIPSNAVNGGQAYSTKRYLDLKILPVNHVIFFTSFVPNNNEFGGGVSAEGACSSSITGIPVPFLITGFVKNPSVITYYAVKGEAKYTGLFFPFSSDGLTLRAYAAAKPFGGRIGPALFKIEGDQIKSRGTIKRTTAYAGGVGVNSASIPNYRPGMPIPFPEGGTGVFVDNVNDVIGGVPGDSSTEIKFITPNLIYDFLPGNMGSHNSDQLMIINAQAEDKRAASPVNPEGIAAGLYDHAQYKAFESNLFGLNTQSISKSIVKLKKPTLYDALNYLIPSASSLSDNAEKVSIVQTPQTLGCLGQNLIIYLLHFAEMGVNTFTTAMELFLMSLYKIS